MTSGIGVSWVGIGLGCGFDFEKQMGWDGRFPIWKFRGLLACRSAIGWV